MGGCERWLNNEMALLREHLILSGPKALTCLSILCLLNTRSILLCRKLPHLSSQGSWEAPGHGISRGVALSTVGFPKVERVAMDQADSVAGRIPWTVVQMEG